MPVESPDHLPEDLEELDQMVARAYSQGVDVGRQRGRTDAVEAFKEFFQRTFYAAKGRRRRADPEDPKVQAINDIWVKFNQKLEDGSLWQ